MKQLQQTTIIYLLIALFAGLVIGLVLQGVQTMFILAVIALAGIAAIIGYMKSDSGAVSETSDTPQPKKLSKDEPVLSKAEARQWLDDFLVEHQEHKK